MAGGSAVLGSADIGKLEEQGFEGKYSIVKEYVRSRKMDLDEKATVRFETMLRKHGQMDWGFFEDYTVYEDGKWKKLYCFLMILGCFRMRYIEFVTDVSTNALSGVTKTHFGILVGIRKRSCTTT